MPSSGQSQSDERARIGLAPVSLPPCVACNNHPRLSMHAYRDMCDDCYNELYTQCYNCSEELRRDDAYDDNGDPLCSICYRDRANDGSDEYSSSWGNSGEREYYKGNNRKHQSKTLGKIVQSKRIFSAEIECYSPSGDAFDGVMGSIAPGIGVSGDGSLNTGGREFQTPKLKGKKGEQVLTQLCTALNRNDFSVNNDCGLHIHLDGKGLLPRTLSKHEPVALKQLWAFYLAYEPVIQSFLPQARRTNRYCYKLAQVATLDKIVACRTQRDIERLWYKASSPGRIDERKSHHYDDTRYAGINLHSLLSAKHLEVRYHSGTLNAQKILQWVNLHTAIMDRASLGGLPIADSATAASMSLPQATAAMFDALNLSQKTRDYLLRRQAKFNQNCNENALTDNETTAICAA